MQLLPCGSNHTTPDASQKNTTLDNEGSSKINQQSITGIISEHMVVYNQQQKNRLVYLYNYIVYIYIQYTRTIYMLDFPKNKYVFRVIPTPGASTNVGKP